MDTIAATKKYERWLSQFFVPVAPDLHHKHEQMREDSFTFLRATFYRWAQHWQQLPSAIRRAPDVLAVGDAHVENFGTWRDAEGSLVWQRFRTRATSPASRPARGSPVWEASSRCPPTEYARRSFWATRMRCAAAGAPSFWIPAPAGCAIS